jgi:hypothetical protein
VDLAATPLLLRLPIEEGGRGRRGRLRVQDAGRAWGLGCEIRKRLVGFVKETYPESRPRLRADWTDRRKVQKRDEGGRDGRAASSSAA